MNATHPCEKGRANGVVLKGADWYTKGPGLEYHVIHGCQTVRPCPHQQLSGSALKIGRREVPSSILGRACRPSRLEFSVVFPETRVNMG